MSNFSSYQGKSIGIVGLGRTGISVYKILKSIVKSVICFDDEANNNLKILSDVSMNDIVTLSDYRWRFLDKIIISPGISPLHIIYKIADSNNIEILSDLDILFNECQGANYIAVTGTNGKSTTSSLIAHILNSNGYDYPLGGNIGSAALSLKLNKPGYILEISSFQLDLIKIFKANIAILLNIAPDHLDRYANMSLYINSKMKIFKNQNLKDCRVINVDNEITETIYHLLNNTHNGIKLIPISTKKILSSGVSIIGEEIYDNIFNDTKFNLPQNLNLSGNHNKENLAASYATCRFLGLNPNNILKAIKNFSNLPHRMQYLGIKEGIHFYNDSKATNSHAASKSLSSLNNIYWLAGGIIKETNISNLVNYFFNIKKAYFFGKDKLLLANIAKNKIDYLLCNNLQDAFKEALFDALKNRLPGCILLAPSASSQDQFNNFEERGQLFINLYNSL